MDISVEKVIELINQNIYSSIPIIVENAFAPDWIRSNAQAENAPAPAAYLPEFGRIHVFIEDLKAAIKLFNKTNKPITEEILIKILRYFLLHEFRHYDQFQWLVSVFGDSGKAVEIFNCFYHVFGYSENPLEKDAFAISETITRGNVEYPDVNSVMIEAVALLERESAV